MGSSKNLGLVSEKAEPGVAGPLTGRLVSGKWRVGELLGLGGMSSVYAATHRNGKRVAIKVLRSDRLGHSRTRRRFLREGYIANRVGHDGVVAVLDDHVDDDGSAFLIMELLEGQNVEQYCEERGGALPPGEVLAIADAVLDVLIAAHAQQIVHRDVKPSNLFLTSAGVLKLLDFGIASVREATGVMNATGDGIVLGTPGFMAPEQARGRRKDIDARTDLWGVGSLMFRLLTGRLVYETESGNEYVVAAATLTAPSLATVAPSLSQGLVELVDRALKSDANDRWQTAAEMQKAVREERAHLVHCPLPKPAPRREAVTLEESLSVNGTSNELPSTQGGAPPSLGTTVGHRVWPYLAYGGVVGAVLIAVFGLTSSMSAKGTAPVQTPAPTQTEERANLPAPEVPELGSNALVPSDRSVTTQQSSPLAVSSLGSNAMGIKSSPSPAPQRAATRRSPGAPADAGATLAAPRPATRLEDVLGERR